MEGELIQHEYNDGVLTLRINRPEKKNALNLDMYRALADALSRGDGDEQVRVIMICGSDHCFTSGNDLSDFETAPPFGENSPVMRFLMELSGARKPLIAAVNGLAIGIGVTMLLHCDLVYVGSSAIFQLPFVSLGLTPEAGSSLLLPRLMGHQRAAELLLFGETFSAAMACEVGIATALFPDSELLVAARNRAIQLAAQPAAAVRLTKSLLKRDQLVPLRETIIEEGKLFLERLNSPEAGEALLAFKQRRKPDFSLCGSGEMATEARGT